MHQNIKSSFSLNDENLWQTVLASQAYGTFFTLHAKFKFHANTKKPKSCDLFLQNFSGMITIGLEGVHNKIELIHDPIMNKPSFVMYVFVKGLHAQESIINSEVEIINPLKNIASKEFSKDFPLKIELVFSDMEGFNQNDLRNSSIIDLEFERDGENLLQKNYSEPINSTTKMELYKSYFKDENIEILDNKNEINLKTAINRKNITDCTSKVKSNGEIFKVVNPYPCYLSYVQFF